LADSWLLPWMATTPTAAGLATTGRMGPGATGSGTTGTCWGRAADC
jgi:hypothetical protein